MVLPTSGPPIIEPNTNTVSSALAAAAGMPCPWTRNGIPHNKVSTFGANIVEKCTQKPSRVPGTRHAESTCRASPRPSALATLAGRWSPGVSLTRMPTKAA